MNAKINNEYADVAQVLSAYYDGLYYGDTAILEEVFHPDAHYATVSGGDLLHLDMKSYFPIVQARQSPESLEEPYGYILESIEFAGPAVASARMRSSMLEKHFIDFLTMINLDGRWRIISKVFHYELQEPTDSNGGK